MKHTIRLTVAAFALSCASGLPAHADMGMGRSRGPAFLRELFPPSLIMQHQTDLGLSDAQREAITKEMTDVQKAIVDLRWQLEEKTAALTTLLSADKVDEGAAMAQADQVLQLEDRLKHVRLGFLIRVKNLLTPAQQEMLRKLPPSERFGRHGSHGGGEPAPEGAEP
jgi:Spy/CpxP family protein refolding chaperone